MVQEENDQIENQEVESFNTKTYSIEKKFEKEA